MCKLKTLLGKTTEGCLFEVRSLPSLVFRSSLALNKFQVDVANQPCLQQSLLMTSILLSQQFPFESDICYFLNLALLVVNFGYKRFSLTRDYAKGPK